MDNEEIQQKCDEFLRVLGVPGFIVFGWKKNEEEFGLVSSYHEVPVNAAIKGLAWALTDFINKTL
jgi:hypothetical protein